MEKVDEVASLLRAISHHRKGELSEAEILYKKIIELNPKNVDALHNFGVLKLAQKQPLEALRYVQAALDINQDIEQFNISYFKILLKLGRVNDAFKFIERVLDKNPQMKDLVKLQKESLENSNHQTDKCDNISNARRAYLTGELDHAETLYSEILQIDQENSEAIEIIDNIKAFYSIQNGKSQNIPAVKGRELLNNFNLGNFEKVIHIGLSLSLHHSRSIELHNIIASAASEMQNYALARRHFWFVTMLNTDSFDDIKNLSVCFIKSDLLPHAVICQELAVSRHPLKAEAYFLLGNTFRLMGLVYDAKTKYEKAINLNPYFTEALYNLGICLAEIGDEENAIKFYEKALSVSPQAVPALINLANLYQQKERYEDAIGLYQDGLKIEPSSELLLSNLARAYVYTNKFDVAEEIYLQLIASKPQEQKNYVNLMLAYDKFNKIEQLNQFYEGVCNNLTNMSDEVKLYAAIGKFRLKLFDTASQLLSQIDIQNIAIERRPTFFEYKGKLAEKLNNFDSAFEAFCMMNNAIKNTKLFNQKAASSYFTHRVLRLKEIKETEYRRPITISIPSKVSFLVGFPRSGTTLLDTILRSHSQIDVAEEDPTLSELIKIANGETVYNFLDSFPSAFTRSKLQQYYLDRMGKYRSNSNKDNILIDKMPLNLLQVPFIEYLFPQTQIIFVKRHPLDSILSNWMQNFKLNDAMANMVDLENVVDFYNLSMDTFYECRAKLNLNVVEIKYEDVTENLQHAVTNLLTSLKLNWEEKLLDYQETAIKRGRINTPSYSQVVQPLYKTSTEKWRNYERYLEPFLHKVEPWLHKLGYD